MHNGRVYDFNYWSFFFFFRSYAFWNEVFSNGNLYYYMHFIPRTPLSCYNKIVFQTLRFKSETLIKRRLPVFNEFFKRDAAMNFPLSVHKLSTEGKEKVYLWIRLTQQLHSAFHLRGVCKAIVNGGSSALRAFSRVGVFSWFARRKEIT